MKQKNKRWDMHRWQTIVAPRRINRRWIWLSKIVNQHRFKLGAEIGIASGKNVFFLLRHCPSLEKIICVDPWDHFEGEYEQYKDWPHESHKQIFIEYAAEQKLEDRINLIQDFSVSASQQVEDGSLDFVFIDGDHSYEGCKADIQTWLPKVRSGGVFSGHDTHYPGVRQAVDEELKGWKEWTQDYVWFIQV